jgi:hypothetical protein
MKYSVEVTITASCTYTVEVEGCSEYDAENRAHEQWRERMPSDFQVEKGYVTNWDTDTTQLTWECEECDKGISEDESRRNDGLCTACNREHEKTEIAGNY